MSQWANENPERMAEIASLPLSEQSEALRGAIGPIATGVICEGCRSRFVPREATTEALRRAQCIPCPDCGSHLVLDY